MDLWKYECARYREKGWWAVIALGFSLAHGLSGPLLTPIYQKLLVTQGEVVTHILMILLVHHTAYVFFGGLTTLMCMCRCFDRYKINPDEWPLQSNVPLIRKAIVSLSWNFVVLLPVYVIISKKYSNFGPSMDWEVPSFWNTVKWVPVFAFVDSFWVYIVHSLLHTRWLYARIHKQHHEFRVTMGIAAEYAHPLEYYFGNLLGATLGPVLFGKRVHFMAVAVWGVYKISQSVDTHSGFEVPWSPHSVYPFASKNYVDRASFHDFHHYTSSGNYGGHTYIWDYLGGTAKHYFKGLKYD